MLTEVLVGHGQILQLACIHSFSSEAKVPHLLERDLSWNKCDGLKSKNPAVRWGTGFSMGRIIYMCQGTCEFSLQI